MRIKFLGTHNAESKTTRLVSFLIDDVLAVEAGSLVSELTLPEQEKIQAILLSHGHYDHIRSIPAFAFNNTARTTGVFGVRQALDILSSHLMDGLIYPRFTEKNSFLKKVALELVGLEPLESRDIAGYRVVSLPVNHPVRTTGFGIASDGGKQVFYTGDTGPGLAAVWERVSPDLLIIETTFPNRLQKMAREAGHLCPSMLGEELAEFRRAKGYLPQVVLIHLSPRMEEEIEEEVEEVGRVLGLSIGIAREGEMLVI